MATVPITLKVEEMLFIPVLKKLNAIPGVSDINVNLDLLTGGAQRKPKQPGPPLVEAPAAANGKDRPSQHELLIALLMNGPQNLKVLNKAFVEAGFVPSGLGSALNVLRKKGVTESAGVGIHKLTEKTRRSLANPALPAPAQEEGKRAKQGASRFAILSALQAADGPVKREDLAEAISAIGASANSITGILDRAVKDDLIRRSKKKGFYELAPKGKHFKPTEEPRSD